MTTFKALLVAGASLALFAGTPASAATLIVDSNGILTGATGVDVLGISYDVEFVEGTFDEAFFSGAALSNLPFVAQGRAGAAAAANALLNQVLIGSFDSDPQLTFGCNIPESCFSAIPHQVVSPLFINVVFAVNFGSTLTLEDGTSDGTLDRPFSLTNNVNTNFARFSVSQVAPPPPPVGAIPEPSTWAMLLLGFFGIGGVLRSARRSRVALTYS